MFAMKDISIDGPNKNNLEDVLKCPGRWKTVLQENRGECFGCGHNANRAMKPTRADGVQRGDKESALTTGDPTKTTTEILDEGMSSSGAPVYTAVYGKAQA